MLVIMEPEATEAQIRRLQDRIKEMGYKPHLMDWPNQVAISVTENKGSEDRVYLEGMQGVFKVVPVSRPYKLASREVHPNNSVIEIGNARFGDGNVVMIAGPCAVESRKQTLRIAQEVKKRGAQMLRGGAYKPRTSPYSFQGLGEEGLEILAEAREKTGLPFVTEALDRFIGGYRGEICGHDPDRYPEYAKFHSSKSCGQDGQTGPDETGHECDHDRNAHVSGIPFIQRRPRSGDLRAWYPDFCKSRAEYTGYQYYSGIEAGNPFAGDRRSKPFQRKALQCHSTCIGRDRRRGRWANRGCPR